MTVLEDGQTYTYYEGWPNEGLEKLRVADPLLLLLHAPDLLDLLNLPFHFSIVAGQRPPQHGASPLYEAVFVKPAWGLRQEKHPDAQDQRRDYRHREHPAPPLDGSERDAHQVGDQDPYRDHELVERNQRPTRVRRGYLGDVERHDERGQADAQTQHKAAEDQNYHGGRQGHDQGSDGEDNGSQHGSPPAAESVSERSARKSADHSPDQQEADYQTLYEVRERPEVLLYKEQSPRDHTRVVAEEQAPRRRDRSRDLYERSLASCSCAGTPRRHISSLPNSLDRMMAQHIIRRAS